MEGFKFHIIILLLPSQLHELLVAADGLLVLELVGVVFGQIQVALDLEVLVFDEIQVREQAVDLGVVVLCRIDLLGDLFGQVPAKLEVVLGLLEVVKVGKDGALCHVD